MIKTIKMKYGKNIQLYKLLFITKIDGNWQIYPVGNTITNSTTIYNTDKISVNSSTVYSSSSSYKIGLAFVDDVSYFRGGNNGEITITFNEPLRVLQGFYYYQTKSRLSDLRIYDENDNLIYVNDLSSLTFDVSTSTSTISKTYNMFTTEGLEILRAYPVNQLGTIETNDNNRLNDVYSIESIKPEQSVSEGNDIRYALSFDKRDTYKSYKNSQWIDVNNDTLMTDGMTVDEISALTSMEFTKVLNNNHTVDILVGMITNNPNTTPYIKKITTDYLKIV